MVSSVAPPPIQPRVCGDYDFTEAEALRVDDTTPRVRGLQVTMADCVINSRYNPACAGTTVNLVFVQSNKEIQPRVCGDYSTAMYLSSCPPDTTPRVRGLLSVVEVILNSYRYNPACAGTTSTNCQNCKSIEIQPRVCGDYVTPNLFHPLFIDTTPRVRGLRLTILARATLSRYNPACAGTTLPSLRPVRLVSIQPRVCGDYSTNSAISSAVYDTTPRVRGLHQRISGTRAILS